MYSFRIYIKKNLVKTTLKNLIQKKKARHEPSVWSMFIRCSFRKKENKLDYYRGKDCIDKLCKKIKESANEIINRKKKRNDTIR